MSEVFNELPRSWEVLPLSAFIAHLESGVSVNADDRTVVNDELGVLSTSCAALGRFMPEEHKAVWPNESKRVRVNPRAGEIIISRMNTPDLVGETGFVKNTEPGLFLPDRLWQTVARANKETDFRWLNQVLQWAPIRKAVRDVATGTSNSMKNISKGVFLALRVPTPPIQEQRGIAEVLTALDEQIQQTEALIEKLVSRRSGLMQEFLIPAAEAAPTVFLGAACSLITSGSRGWARHYAADGALFLRIGNLTRENPNMLLEDLVRVDVPAGGEGARTRLEPGDILISITADLGVIGCIPDEFEEAYVNQHIALARINDANLSQRWVAHYLGSPLGYEQISRLNDGGAKAGLNLPTIRALKIPKPIPDVQAWIVALLDAVDGEIAMERALLTKLHLQKQGLMHDLLTGATLVR